MESLETFSPVSNGAAPVFEAEHPYSVEVTIEGVAPLLFHRWNVEAVEGKAKAAKGSKAKKSDDIESYVYRNEKGNISVPGEYLRQSVIHAAKFTQDPRSPRKSAMDLFRAGLTVLDELCDLGAKDWDYLDKRRVQVQRQGITRTRPAMATGWKLHATFCVLTPEYIPPMVLHERLVVAGRLIGVGDFRPTYGRFSVIGYKLLKD